MTTPPGYGACILTGIDEATYVQLVLTYAATDVVPNRHAWKSSVHFDVWMQEGCDNPVLPPPPDARHRMSMGILCNILQRRDRTMNLPVTVSWHIDSIPDQALAAWSVLCRDCFDAHLSSVAEYQVNHDVTISAHALYRLGGMSGLGWTTPKDAVHIVAGRDSDLNELVRLVYTLSVLKACKHSTVSMALQHGMKEVLRVALCASIENEGNSEEVAAKRASDLIDDVSVEEITEEASTCSGTECSSVSVSCQ